MTAAICTFWRTCLYNGRCTLHLIMASVTLTALSQPPVYGKTLLEGIT